MILIFDFNFVKINNYINIYYIVISDRVSIKLEGRLIDGKVYQPETTLAVGLENLKTGPLSRPFDDFSFFVISYKLILMYISLCISICM